MRNNSSTGSGATASIPTIYGLNQEHLSLVRSLSEYPDCDPKSLVEAFYQWLEGQPWKTRFFATGVPSTVRTAQVAYWKTFFAARVDESYIASRISVGETHARINLPPLAYSSAMAFSQGWIGDLVHQLPLDENTKARTINAVSLLCQVDAAIVMDTYFEHSYQLAQSEADKLTLVNQEINRVMLQMGVGDFSVRYAPQSHEDEHLAQAINDMASGVENSIRLVKAIASGKYNDDITPVSDQDQLGHALLEMTSKLREVTRQTNRDQWLKQGQAELFEQMRGELSVELLGHQVLDHLCQFLEIPMGVLYIHGNSDGLELKATVGIAQEDLQREIKSGEGIIGEAARRRQANFEFDISNKPVRATYGIGYIELKTISLVPLEAAGELMGVLQLASAEPLPEMHREFIRLSTENIAIALDGAHSRSQMSRLLEQSQRQSEELQAQAHELSTSNDELAKRGADLNQARLEVEARNQALQKKQVDIEIAQKTLKERAEQLALTNKYKGEFLANMSHELRTPLNSMLLLLHSLLENREGNLSRRQLDALGIIQGGSKDLLQLINDILDLSKVEAGKLSLEVKEIDLESLRRTLEGQFLPLAEQAGLQLNISMGQQLPQYLYSDRLRLEQILKNLLANAIKFTHQGSVTLEISAVTGTQRIRHAHLREQEALEFSIRDTGIGIPQEKRELIFEAFQQADGSTSRNYGGTGLGLTISTQLAELLQGELDVQSADGEGSCFTLVIPAMFSGHQKEETTTPFRERPSPKTNLVAKAKPRTAPPAPEPKLTQPSPLPAPIAQAPVPVPDGSAKVGPEARKHILVIEDDAGFATHLSAIIEELGYQVTTTTNGKEGLMKAQLEKPQGIILDLGLDDIDGLEVLEQLKSMPATYQVPVQIVSGHACVSQGLELGALGFSLKPVTQEDIVNLTQRFEKVWNKQSGRILIVEDDKGTLSGMISLFQGEGIDLDWASSGTEALQKLRSDSFDSLILDLGLPDFEGLGFFEQLPADHPPVAVYTARDLSPETIEQIEAKSESLFIKGKESPGRMVNKIKLLLKQGKASPTSIVPTKVQPLKDPKNILAKKQVLVVDDDVRNQFALAELLQRQDMEVIQAGTGKVALEQLDKNPEIDLVLMDVMMPVMDGLEATRRIRAQPRFESLPIIAVTARTLAEDRQACLTAGANDYLSKPMDQNNLLALMRVLLNQRNAPTAQKRHAS